MTYAEAVHVIDGLIVENKTDEIQAYFIPNESNFETGGLKTKIVNNTKGKILLTGREFQIFKDGNWITLPRPENVTVLDVGIIIEPGGDLDIFFFIPVQEVFDTEKYRLYATFVDRESNISYRIFKEFVFEKGNN